MKSDLFDRFVERFLKKDPQKRLRQVIISALVLLFLCLMGAGGLLYYASKYPVPEQKGSLLQILFSKQQK